MATAFLWRLIRQASLIFLPAALMLGLVLAILHQKAERIRLEVIEIREMGYLDIAANQIRRDFQESIGDLRVLSNMSLLQSLGDGGGPGQGAEIARHLQGVVMQYDRYARARLLDRDGYEILSVDNAAIPSGAKDRPSSFGQEPDDGKPPLAALELGRDEVYVSPLLPGREQGMRVMPYKPLILFATPVFDPQGRKQGTLILDYLADTFLAKFHRYLEENPLHQAMLLDGQGDSIQNWPQSSEETPSGRLARFSDRNPLVWDQIQSTGRAKLETNEGLFLFTTIHPSLTEEQDEALRQQASLVDNPRYRLTPASVYPWKIVLHLPASTLKMTDFLGQGRGLGFLGLLYALMALATLVIAYHVLKRQETLDALNASLEDNRRLVHSLPLGVYRFRQPAGSTSPREGRFDFVSQRFCDLVGVVSDQVLADPSAPSRCIHPEDRESLLATTGRALAEGQPLPWEGRVLTPVGIRWLRFENALTLDQKGDRLWHGTVTDITSRVLDSQAIQKTQLALRHLNAKLAARTAEAESANQTKSQFLANISHEIRTPLNAMLGMAQLLEREPLNSRQGDMVRRILAAGHGLTRIFNDILDFSRIEAGNMPIAPKPFNPVRLLKRVEASQGQRAARKGLKFDIEASPLPRVLIGNGQRLEQVLTNLIGNAIEFTEGGEVRVQVQVFDHGDDELRLRFAIKDTGIGMDAASLERLFTPFTQIDAGSSRRHGGTGLGLAISQRLIRLMGGDLRVTSQVGVGSTFSFELPFQRDDSDWSGNDQDLTAPSPSGAMEPEGPAGDAGSSHEEEVATGSDDIPAGVTFDHPGIEVSSPLPLVPPPKPEPGRFPAIPGIDREYAERQFNGDRAFFLDLLRRFAAQALGLVAAIDVSLDGEDYVAASNDLHKLRGLADNLCATELVLLARKLETAIQHQKAEIPPLRLRFLQSVHALLGAITPWLQEEALGPAPLVEAEGLRDDAGLQVLLAELEDQLLHHRFDVKRTNVTIEELLSGSHLAESYKPVAEAARRLRFKEARERLVHFHHALAEAQASVAARGSPQLLGLKVKPEPGPTPGQAQDSDLHGPAADHPPV